MSVMKRAVIGAAASTLVVATVAAGSPASASEIKIKAPVSGKATIKKTGDTLRLPKGAKMTASLFLPSAKLRKGILTVPTITAHMNTALVPGLPTIPITAKVNMIQTKKVRGRIIQKGKKRGHLRAVAHTRLAIPKATLDLPLLKHINIVQDTCTTKPFKIRMTSQKKLNLSKPFRVKTKFKIPKFTGCSIVNVPPFGLRNKLLTQLISGPGNKLTLKVGPIQSNA